MGVFVYGSDIKEIFLNSAYAFRKIVGGRRKLTEKFTRKISLQSENYETLLFLWLSEFLYLYDSQRLLPMEINDFTLKDYSLEATVKTGILNSSPLIYIKAITMHKIAIERRNGKLRARVIFDL